jgi:hypothetical protein
MNELVAITPAEKAIALEHAGERVSVIALVSFDSRREPMTIDPPPVCQCGGVAQGSVV